MSNRIPPIFFCPLCEIRIKFDGLRAGNKAQFVEKKCSECQTAEANTTTGADRHDPLKGLK